MVSTFVSLLERFVAVMCFFQYSTILGFTLILCPSFVTPQSTNATTAQTLLNEVLNKYSKSTGIYGYFIDKEVLHNETLGLKTITSTLLLSNCYLRRPDILKAGQVSDVSRVHGFEIIKGTALFPNVTLSCDLTIKRSGIHWKSRISAEALNVTIELSIVRDLDFNQYLIKPGLSHEPEIRLYVDDNTVFWFVRKYHLDEVSTHLSNEINWFYKSYVRSKMNNVAKEMSN